MGRSIQFIGVGPGDPELLALKALNILKHSDIIFHAGPRDHQGLAYETVKPHLTSKQTVRSIKIEMTCGQDDWERRYAPAVAEIAAHCEGGKRVAYITEGDPSLYSTASYISELIARDYPHINCEWIAGVSSITAAACRARLPLARGTESISITVETHPFPGLPSTTVFLKPTNGVSSILNAVSQDSEIVYGERISTENEFISTDREEIAGRNPPYFSLMIARHGQPMLHEGTLWIVGLGPGQLDQMTVAARAALHRVDAIVGYEGYLNALKPLSLRAELFCCSIGQEIERADKAIELAQAGRCVAIISSGDAGVYGMASIVMERAYALAEEHKRIRINICPGVTAATAAASLLGAPLGHDFACISLSDLLTSWAIIENRVRAAAESDFVIALYNPASEKRRRQLPRACEIIKRSRAASTPVGIVRSAYRDGQEITLTNLAELAERPITMHDIIIIGNSQTRQMGQWMVTPRGYACSDPLT